MQNGMSGPAAAKTVEQAGKFGLVGLLMTALDFAFFNAFRLASASILVANLTSTTICMVISFLINRRYVFAGQGSSWKRQALLFFPSTAFALYVLQSGAILFLTRLFPFPLDISEALARAAGITSPAALLHVRANTAKLAATAVSLTWNYCFYRWAVFAERPATR
jgi:putative flippase GtrA